MKLPSFKYIYGPVYSWRLGMSLGVDPLGGDKKYCNFGCAYCQLGRFEPGSFVRKAFVSSEMILSELSLLPQGEHIDYVTFSGNGEPTLAANLGELIRAVRSKFSWKTAVITNSSTIPLLDVQSGLMQADFVLFKMDASNQDSFRRMNSPVEGIVFSDIIEGIKSFKRVFKGRLALQIMLTQENMSCAADIAGLARDISPDEVQLNTPLRPGGMSPLTKADLSAVAGHFSGLNVLSVYDVQKKFYMPFDEDATRRRHGENVWNSGLMNEKTEGESRAHNGNICQNC